MSLIDRVYFFPKVDSWIRGLVNFRGDIHSIVDLKAVLGEASTKDEPMQILIKAGETETAIAVESIVDKPDESDMTVAQLKGWLDEHDVVFPKDAKKADLFELYLEKLQAANNGND